MEDAMWTKRGLRKVDSKVEQKAQSDCDIFRQWGTKKIDWTYNKSLLERTVTDKKISLLTLLEKVKLVALENNEFQNWQNEKINWTFSHVRPINIPIQGTKAESVPSRNLRKI